MIDESKLEGAKNTGITVEQFHSIEEDAELFEKYFGSIVAPAYATNLADQLGYRQWFCKYLPDDNYYAIINDLGNGWWNWEGWIIEKNTIKIIEEVEGQ